VHSRFRIIVAVGLVVSLFTASLSAAAQDNDNNNDTDIDPFPEHEFAIHGFEFHEPEFYNVWARTDLPVQQLETERSWLWGPAANTPLFDEPYVEAEGGMRGVQYSDKSRMEMPVPGSAAAAPEDSPWNITQGLLALELMTGNLQLGDDTFEQYEPAEIPVAGDWEDNPGPTYADMAVYMDWGARNTGWTITQYFDEDGVVQDDDRFAEYGVYDRYYIPETDHNIASVFWEFMQSEGLVYEDGDLTTGPVFLDEFYAVGFPITEAYWGEFLLRGEIQDILIQCFERRCLTYAPNNPVEWQVESGNVGLHYHEWRYTMIGEPLPPPPAPELSLVLDPAEATNPVGTDYTLTATVMENDTAQAIGSADDVSITVARGDDSDVNVDEEISINEAGVASITYGGPEAPAVDTITVGVEYGDETLTATATKTWADFTLELDQTEDTNIVGTVHTFTATLTDVGADAPAEFAADDVQITITRGTDSVTPTDLSVDSIEDGVATITYTGPSTPAVDQIDVSVNVLGTSIVGAPQLTKTWVTAFDYYECDVLVEDDQSIQAAIDAATDDQTICVEPGTYNENVEIDVDGLSLIALGGPEVTTIQSNTTGDAGVVGMTANDIALVGFTIDNLEADVDSRAIRVHDSVDGVTIQNNVIQNSLRGVQGNWTSGGDNITIAGNTFDVDYGIAGTEDMTGLVVTGNTFNTSEEGIGLGEGIENWVLETNHFNAGGSHFVDYRDTPVPDHLVLIIDANTFENEVHVVGNAIVDVE
jgi:hypothetical protein